jgi:hypothetical protein
MEISCTCILSGYYIIRNFTTYTCSIYSVVKSVEMGLTFRLCILSIATRVWAGRLRNNGSMPDNRKRFISLPVHPN